MKKLFVILLIVGIAACENQEVTFPDYDLKAVYFPVQLPIRTLSLGEDRLDNSLDKQYIFDIGATIGGMYENKREWTIDYVVDPSLTNDVYTNTDPNLKIIPLPTEYYTISPLNKIIIPKGEFNGRIRIQLTRDFFDDPLALTGQYVVPLRMTNTSADSILLGKPATDNPDPRIKADWESAKFPKNWTMYGIKYVNAYHGTYLHRGNDVRVITETGNVHDTVYFGDIFGHREKDPLINLTTLGITKARMNGLGNLSGEGRSLVLNFDNENGKSGSITISPCDDADYEVTGTGRYFDKASSSETWSFLMWQAMYLNYTYQDNTYTHNIRDTLVFRDRGLKWEENNILILP